MHLSSLVHMIESGYDARALLTTDDGSVSGAEFGTLVRRGAAALSGAGSGASSAVVYVGENHPLLPVALFSAAWAGLPFVPVNYRLEDAQLNALIARYPDAAVFADTASADRVETGATVFDDWVTSLPEDPDEVEPPFDDDEVAIVLFTSGTTSEPKSALLRHRHLMAYLLSTVEFGGAAEDDAMLVSVPPYHIAGVANMLSNLYAGRRLVYLQTFDPATWMATARSEAITNAMVVPTMLARIIDQLDGAPAQLPTLRSLSYGGAKVSERVITEALQALPDTGFVNAYGLTETSSSIAVLGPDDHRDAVASDEPEVRRRLGSAGRVLPTVELQVRHDDGTVLDIGETGIIWVRGEQISGEYATGSVLDDDGWFCTRDRGSVDAEGYLFIEGRADDTIIRGGENIAPAEIEAVLLAEPGVAQACVVGVPDDEWGQRIVAAVVPRPESTIDTDVLRDAVRSRLRGSKTPDQIVVRDELPHTDTGKLLRRVVLQELS